MVHQESTGFCQVCNKNMLLRRKGTNHILHLILSLITGGLWIIIWVLVTIKVGGWRCTTCGTKSARDLLR